LSLNNCICLLLVCVYAWCILAYSSVLCAAYIPPPVSYLWVIGVVFGGLVVILGIIWLFLFTYYSCKRTARRSAKTGFLPPTQQHFDTVHLPQEHAVRNILLIF